VLAYIFEQKCIKLKNSLNKNYSRSYHFLLSERHSLHRSNIDFCENRCSSSHSRGSIATNESRIVDDNYVDETNEITQARGPPPSDTFAIVESHFVVWVPRSSSGAGVIPNEQITFAIANTGAVATGQIDPAAVTYHLVSEQHKNVITPVIGNARERRCSASGRAVERERRSSELREGRDVWFGNANQARRSRARRATGSDAGKLCRREINLVSQWTEVVAMYDTWPDIDFRDYEDSRSPFRRYREWIINGKRQLGETRTSGAGCAVIIGERKVEPWTPLGGLR